MNRLTVRIGWAHPAHAWTEQALVPGSGLAVAVACASSDADAVTPGRSDGFDARSMPASSSSAFTSRLVCSLFSPNPTNQSAFAARAAGVGSAGRRST